MSIMSISERVFLISTAAGEIVLSIILIELDVYCSECDYLERKLYRNELLKKSFHKNNQLTTMRDVLHQEAYRC